MSSGNQLNFSISILVNLIDFFSLFLKDGSEVSEFKVVIDNGGSDQVLGFLDDSIDISFLILLSLSNIGILNKFVISLDILETLSNLLKNRSNVKSLRLKGLNLVVILIFGILFIFIFVFVFVSNIDNKDLLVDGGDWDEFALVEGVLKRSEIEFFRSFWDVQI